MGRETVVCGLDREGMGLRYSAFPTPASSLFLPFCPHLLLPTLFRRPGQLVAHSLHNRVGSVFILEQGLDLLQVAGEQGIVDCWVSAGAARPSEPGPGAWGAPLAPAQLCCRPAPVLPLQPLSLQAERAQCGGGKGEGLFCHGKGPRGLSGQWQLGRAR